MRASTAAVAGAGAAGAGVGAGVGAVTETEGEAAGLVKVPLGLAASVDAVGFFSATFSTVTDAVDDLPDVPTCLSKNFSMAIKLRSASSNTILSSPAQSTVHKSENQLLKSRKT
jgi:hypothetical protein